MRRDGKARAWPFLLNVGDETGRNRSYARGKEVRTKWPRSLYARVLSAESVKNDDSCPSEPGVTPRSTIEIVWRSCLCGSEWLSGQSRADCNPATRPSNTTASR